MGSGNSTASTILIALRSFALLSGLNHPQGGKKMGKTLYAQGMEFVSWKTFAQFISAPPSTPKGTDMVRHAAYVLLAIVKSELELDASLYTCPKILPVSVFPKTEFSCSFQPDLPKSGP